MAIERVRRLALLRIFNGSDRIGCSFLFPVSRALVYFHDNFLWPSKTQIFHRQIFMSTLIKCKKKH